MKNPSWSKTQPPAAAEGNLVAEVGRDASLAGFMVFQLTCNIHCSRAGKCSAAHSNRDGGAHFEPTSPRLPRRTDGPIYESRVCARARV